MVTKVPHLISNSQLPLVFIYTVYKDETIYLKKHKNAETFKLSQYWSLHVYEFLKIIGSTFKYFLYIWFVKLNLT